MDSVDALADSILNILVSSPVHAIEDLWGMKDEEIRIIEEKCGNVHAQELKSRKSRRSNFDGKVIEELQDIVADMGIQVRDRMTRNGLIDVITQYTDESDDFDMDISGNNFDVNISGSDSSDEQSLDIELDDDQQRAVEMRHKKRLYIYAGPGSGKTTVLCHIAKKLMQDNPQTRILMLAYNVVAEEILTDRLARMNVPMINKFNFCNQSAYGVLPLTLDKTAYQIRMFFEKGPRSKKFKLSYSKSFDMACKYLKRKTKIPAWDVIIVDESQDITSKHKLLIDGMLRSARLIAAGDPRQELCSDGTWFSTQWLTAPEDSKVVLRYNHRSSVSIVALLNAYSRANFPTLHQDQIPSRTDMGTTESYTIDTKCRKWLWNRMLLQQTAMKIGEQILDILDRCDEDITDICAITPVTTERWNLKGATLIARNGAHAKNPLAQVRCTAWKGSIEGSFVISHVQPIKGSEKKVVIFYGCDMSYAIKVSDPQMIKNCFVALSRAKDKLCIINRLEGADNMGRIMLPAIKSCISKSICKFGNFEVTDSLPAYKDCLEVVGQSSAACGLLGLSNMSIIPANVMKTFRDVPIMIINIVNDSDFVGLFVECLVAKQFGTNIRFSKEINVDERYQNSFISCDGSGSYKITTNNKNNKDRLSSIISNILEGANDDIGSYEFVLIKYAVLMGRIWNVSYRLKTLSCVGEDRCASWIMKIIKNELPAKYRKIELVVKHTPLIQKNKSIPLEDHRPAGRIQYIPDFILVDKDYNTNDKIYAIVEFKYCSEITDDNRRQLSIYAGLAEAEVALLYNALTGEAELIYPFDHDDIHKSARATLAMYYASNLSIYYRTANTSERINTMRGMNVVSIGCSTTKTLTKVSAIVFDQVNQDIIAIETFQHSKPKNVMEELIQWISLNTIQRSFIEWEDPSGTITPLSLSMSELGESYILGKNTQELWKKINGSNASITRIGRAIKVIAPELPGNWDRESSISSMSKAIATMVVFIATTAREVIL